MLVDVHCHLDHPWYDKDRDEFTCKNNLKLSFLKEGEQQTRTGYKQKFKQYYEKI